jgi:signal transduction histidine kinase
MAAINRAIGGSLDATEILKAVGDTAEDILEADRVVVMIGSDPRDLRVARIAGSPHPELVEGQALDLVEAGAWLQVRALEERAIEAVDETANDARVNRALARRWEMGSAVVVPLAGHDRTFGLMVISCVRPRPWTEDEVDMAQALAAQASVALDNARLYEEARKAYQELQDAQQRIMRTEKMAVLGTFASGLAHEVRNPLNSIGLQLSLLERRIGRLDAQRAREMGDLTRIIREEVRRLDELVGDFLLFSRTDRLNYRPASLEGVIDEVVQLMGPEATGARVALRRSRIGGSVPSVQMDAEKMKQVLINLVRNAVEAMPDGGEVTVESGVVDGQVRLRVRDTGPGLPEGVDVFQLFVTTKPKGTGLGLSIVQQIVLQHGGEITAASEAGRGAAFTVSLPLPVENDEKEGARA